MANGPEKQIEDVIKKDLDACGAYYLKNFASPNTPKGHPDITAVVPKNRGKLIAIEVKKPVGGVPSEIQIRRLVKIAKNGGRALITADPRTVEYLLGNDDIEVTKIKIKTALENMEKIWTKRDKSVDIIEIIK